MGGKSIEELVREAKGINIHGNSLRISFQYQGSRVRETLGLEPTKANLKYAINLRAAVMHDIKTGVFDYAKRFPDSKNSVKFGVAVVDQSIRVGELAERYFVLKEPDIGIQTVDTYRHSINSCITALGKDRIMCSITGEDILLMRNELISTRKASTVNTYLVVFSAFLEFCFDNGYTKYPLNKSATPFKTKQNDPDPLEVDEFQQIIDIGCKSKVDENLITVAVYTGLRTSELCALSWEDIDLDNNTIDVKRNITRKREFKLTKTSDSRTVYLMPPAVDALKSQRKYTFMAPAETIHVHQVDKRQMQEEKIRPVFRPGVNPRAKRKECEPWFTAGVLNSNWINIINKSGVRYRSQYQTRHTYACWGLTSHGNVSFIANQLGHKDLNMVIKVYGRWMDSSSRSESDFIWNELQKKGHGLRKMTQK